MKNGTKIGPTSAHTALAISPNATTASDTTFASVTTISKSQYSRFARIDQASGWTKRCHKLVEMIERQFQRSRVQNVREAVRLIGDQVAERHADAGNRRLIERDQGVAERDEQQQLRKVEEMIAHASPG